MSLSISQNFNGRTLLRFALPSMVMMIFMSLYTIVDGIFVSRYVGDAALSSINIVYPIISVFTAIGVMLATGGCAVIGKRLGEGKKELARENLTLFVIFSIIISVLLSAIFLCFAKPIVILLGANDVLIPYCVRYLSILMWFAPISVLQLLFLSYFVVASKPNLGLFLTVLSGIINVVLDYVFLDIFQAGIEGAAFATGIGQTIPAIVGLIVFLNKKKELHFCKFKWDGKALLKACSNGASEMVTHMSAAIVTFLFNIIMMKLAGESGVAAITIVLYGQFLFHSMYLGYSMGVAPIFSFQYGANNQRQLKNVFKLSILFITISSVIITIASFGLADFIVAVFVERGSKTFLLAKSGFFLFSINYLFCGTNIFASSLFTALSDGKTSAIISFLRTFFFIIVSLLTLPAILGITGVWLAVPFAELLTIFIAIMYLVRKKKNYNY